MFKDLALFPFILFFPTSVISKPNLKNLIMWIAMFMTIFTSISIKSLFEAHLKPQNRKS